MYEDVIKKSRDFAYKDDEKAYLNTDEEEKNMNIKVGELNQNQLSKKPAKRLLIAAYKRSGSTLTGELFGTRKETFYLFEPSATMYVDWYKAFTRFNTSS